MDTSRPQLSVEVETFRSLKAADVFVIAPATANVIAKGAHGIAGRHGDDHAALPKRRSLSLLAMNTGMYDNPVTQENLAALRKRGFHIIEPDAGRPCLRRQRTRQAAGHAHALWGIEKALTGAGSGRQACSCHRRPGHGGGHGPGSVPGPTTPPAKWVYAIAARSMRGADTTLVSGPTALRYAAWCHARVDIVSARDMYDAVTSRAPEQDFIINAAAVGDYRPAQTGWMKTQKG